MLLFSAAPVTLLSAVMLSGPRHGPTKEAMMERGHQEPHISG